jgi:photosystem II stability/assembly factor-like uncharacterized protein
VRASGEFLAGTTNGLFSLAADNSWEAIGLPVSQVISLVETPKHAILARCNNGLFRSSDSGEHWTDISINSTHTIIPSLAESAHGTLVTAMGLTAFRSKDGEHWTATSIGPNGSSFGTVYHTGGSTFYFYNDYLYRSSNDGATWQLQDNLAQVRPIQFSSKDNLVFGANYSGIYRSRDSGAHWDSVFRRGTVISSGAFVRVVNVYDSGRYNTYASSDAGDSWRLVPTQNQYQIYASAVGSSGVYFAANAGVLRATDLSAAYTATSLTNYSTAIATNGPTVVAFDSKRGIYYSGDGGNSWHRSQGVYDSVLTLSSDAKGRYFAGTMGGIYRSEDSGKTFISSSAGLEPTALNFATTPSENGLAVARNGHAFANAIGWGLAESTDDGDHWRLIDTTNFAYSGIPFWVAPTGRIFRRPNTKSYYLAYSDDEGATWTTTDQLLLQNLAFDSVGGVVAFNGPSGSNIYVHYSSDGGAHWQEFDGLHSYGIDCRAAVDPKGQVYLCNLFFGGADGQHAVITTSNFADTTQHSVLDTVSITAIGIDRGGYVYAGASNLLHTYTYALYLSTDRGATWTNIRTSTFPEESIRSILPTDQYIYVGTDGGGLMRMPRTGTAGASSRPSSESATVRIHPMPANSVTTIDLGSSDASTISIVNSLGVCLAEYQSTGSQLNVDTRALPSGVYSVIARSTHGTHASRLVVKH